MKKSIIFLFRLLGAIATILSIVYAVFFFYSFKDERSKKKELEEDEML